MIRIETPDAWKDAIDAQTVEVLPLVADRNRSYVDGWCTYTDAHAETPELEFLCGGVNSKTPKAGAVWRQGNLLHFGFEQSPSEMNETGRHLLVNAIAYISRFGEDRPIIDTPSPFVPGARDCFDRGVIRRLAENTERDVAVLERYTTAALYEQLQDRTHAELSAWFRENHAWIHADEAGKLAFDEEARSFGTGPATAEFLERAISALRGAGDRAQLARRLLARYVPDGPADGGSADEWAAWYAGHRPYLFFSDTGGFRWYVDPLAKARGVPTEELRGAARASREPLTARPAEMR